jgi:hypothetical protein
MAFAAAFIAGAFAIFAAADAAGAALGSARMPLEWRIGVAGALLLSLAAVDLFAMAKSTYCPIGWRRQTPRMLMRRLPAPVAASLWGFDTGLVVTTFRVAAVSWAALLLAALGLSPRWAGAGYGLAFTLPFLALVSRPRLGRSASGAAPVDPGFESMLRKRGAIQALSASVLAASGAILIASMAGG